MKAKITESDITRQIRDYLKACKIFHWKVWQGLGSEKGVADIIGIYRGIPLAIEVKAPNGKLSVSQDAFLANFKREGGVAIIARSVDDVIKSLREIPLTE